MQRRRKQYRETIPTIPEVEIGPIIDPALNWNVLQIAHGRERTAERLLAGLMHLPLSSIRAWRDRLPAAHLEAVADVAARAGAPVRAWVPRYRRMIRASRHARARRRPVELALMPGYCLVAVPDARMWPAVAELDDGAGGRLVRGVLQARGTDGTLRPARVSRADLSRLLEALAELAAGRDLEHVRRRLVPGTVETVRSGAAEGTAVRIEDVAIDAVRAWMPMLGADRLVRLPLSAFMAEAAA